MKLNELEEATTVASKPPQHAVAPLQTATMSQSAFQAWRRSHLGGTEREREQSYFLQQRVLESES